MTDHRITADEGRSLDPGGVGDGRSLIDPLRRPGSLSRDLAHHPALEGIPVGLKVALDAADVAPVTPSHRCPERVPAPQHLWKDVLRPVAGLTVGAVVENGRLNHIDPGVDLVAEHLAPRRLLQEALDATVGSGDHHPVLERI